MASFSKLLSSVLIALIYASTTGATPLLSTSKHATHRTRTLGADGSLKLETFHPESIFEGFGVEGLDHSLTRRAGGFDIKTASVSFLASKLGIRQNDIQFRTSAKAEVAQHAFLKQQINGVPVANAVANVAFSDDGKVLSFSSSFVKPSGSANQTPTVSLSDAIATAEKALDGAHNGHPATLEFLIQPDGSAALTHVIQIQNDRAGTWVEAFVDAHSNNVVSVTDFVAKSSVSQGVAAGTFLPVLIVFFMQYRLPGGITVFDPQDLVASPLGWHSDGTTNTTVTAGNNVFAAKGSTATPQTSPVLNFIYDDNFGQAPTTITNVNAAVVNVFYLVNTVHDLTYRYGFTETTFNFQTNNFGKGGIGNDRVTASVQDPAGTDNADFSTPPDGQSGHMRMFLWDFTSPARDGAVENDIVIHENTHGVTNRMTGGGTARCLQTTEAGGMGEGWSDSMADWASQGPTTVDFVLGTFVINDPAGIRSHPYSTSATTNPLRYSSLKTLTEVHDIGEVWANILHNVYASLATAHGWSATPRKNPGGTEGNIVFLHLFLDALLLQPCNPTFLSARDAWIQADANRYAGANKCLLWNVFASRGLGVNAANHNDDSTVPAGC
ncbi:Fungalysin metallopeptidase-domain-containing protein [Lactarius akahatsu]|uniref:Extracellular metalloproteinase n=1 Tax=Lactarius akahatsu TaxID=416441 RepID=A0AAD4LFP4_9AGAM|nr:Fungalysin metallopeptidase-domain-containing protein [Lactarius akahatsu]